MRPAAYIAVLIGYCAVAGAVEPRRPQVAPLNPAFVEFMAARSRPTAQAPGAFAPGLVPVPVDLSAAARTQPRPAALPRSFPARYDLRELGRVTPVRNQSPYGTCWAHASYGSVESCLRPAEDRFFSVNNLVNRHGFDQGYSDGGNWAMSLAYLARWDGPVDEADDPFPNPGHSPSNLPVQKHLQQTYRLFRTNALDNDQLKYAVMNHGAIYVAFYWTGEAFNDANNTFYYTGTNRSQNHAVALAGWDDAYSRTNFTPWPSGDGAYIIKNSFGTNWAECGYFYMTYYEPTFWGGAVFCAAEAATNYDAQYAYDPLGWITCFGYGTNIAWGANVFTTTSAVELCAVGFYTPTANTRYQLYVYADVVSNAPREGLLLAAQAGEVMFAGYHTKLLNSPVSLPAGVRFSVVLSLDTPGFTWPLPVEMVISGYCSQVTAAPGQSFASPDGTNWWYDITEYDPSMNFCFKAFGRGLAATAEVVGAVADYDGDRNADPAVCYPDFGAWKIKLSSQDYQTTTTLKFSGRAAWRSACADYDGDGLADYGVYDRTTGEWQVRLSTAGYALVILPNFALGAPAQADYDGDARADPCVYDAAAATWRVRLSSAGYALLELASWFGGATQVAAVADFDGDSKADPCMYGRESGTWLLLMSSAGYAPLTLAGFLGGTGWNPVPADYDGDGKADPAVYEIATGNWAVLLSSGGYARVDLPGFMGAP